MIAKSMISTGVLRPGTSRKARIMLDLSEQLDIVKSIVPTVVLRSGTSRKVRTMLDLCWKLYGAAKSMIINGSTSPGYFLIEGHA